MAKLSKTQEMSLKQRSASCFWWIQFEKMIFPPNDPFDLANHIYQKDIFNMFPQHPDKRISNMCIKKAAQVGVSLWAMLIAIHGLRFGHYPTGVIHWFPTDMDAQYISKTKLQPLIDNNRLSIAPFIGKVNEVGARQIGRGYYYMRGARETKKEIGSSSKIKSISADINIFDEYDEMDFDMVELAYYRLLHSKVKEQIFISTPTLPEFGIDKIYSDSDETVWVIKCNKCGKDTVLELEFPDILIETSKGDVFRVCRHCRKPLTQRNIAQGQWVCSWPDKTKDMHGRWISSLSIPGRDPKSIYRKMQSSDPIVLKNLYNSELAMPYQQADDSLTKQDVLNCCDPGFSMRKQSLKPSAMGVDVKDNLKHVVVGHLQSNELLRITYLARVSEWAEIHDIAAAANVKCAAICYEPQTTKVREFRAQEPYNVYLVDYQERLKSTSKVDEKEGIYTIRRTETMDTVISIFKNSKIILPRRNPEIDNHYAVEMTKAIRIIKEDRESGSRRGAYKKTGPDDYFHATNYFTLACKDYKLIAASKEGSGMRNQDEKNNEYDPFDMVREGI